MILKVVNEAKGDTSIEMGYLPFVPAFGLLCSDAGQDDGIIYVELNGRKSLGPDPAFVDRKINDIKWYPFFNVQIIIL
ncbi:MAG: hypothetical protein OEZ02_09340 [Anaerolineae bacterium]|nr:hypothetical protein [Anaerolineae bacterium]